MSVEKTTVGLVFAFLLVTAGAFCGGAPGVFFPDQTWVMPTPSSELLRGIAGLGGALVLAYVVQATWMVRETQPDEDDEHWVGFVAGAGAAGLAGVALALLLAEHRDAGYNNAIDVFGSLWVWTSLGMLALIVVLHPLQVYRMTGSSDPDGK